MKKISSVFLLGFLLLTYSSWSQNNNVGIGTVTPAPSALLDIDASPANDKGLLVPRITAVQRLAIVSPANSLLVFDTDSACFFFWKTTVSSWISLCGSGSLGVVGATGPTGLSGTTGFIGITGATGVSGSNGSTGSTGIAGLMGVTGSAGTAGLIGTTGTNGLNGSTGATGVSGIAGTTGATGLGTICNTAAANYVTKFTSATDICNSSIYDNGTNVGINTGTSPDASAKLDVTSTNMGLLVPRLTTAQRNAIASPAHSLLIFNTTTNCYEWWDSVGNAWVSMSCGASGCVPPTVPAAGAATNITASSFSANWAASSGATTYYLDVSTDAVFTTFLNGYNNLNTGNVLTLNITGLTCATTYYYRVRGATTCSSTSSSVITAVTIGAPAQPGAIIGSLTFCSGSAGNIYSIAPVSGASSYTWNVPAGATITSGVDTTTITVTFGSTGGNISVTANNSCGSSIANTKAVSPGSPTILTTTPASVVCSGTVTLGATASSGATVNWYAAVTGGTALATGNSYTTPTITSTTTYYVEAVDNGCASSPRTPVIATVKKVVALRARVGFCGLSSGDNDIVNLTFDQVPISSTDAQACSGSCTCSGTGTTFQIQSGGGGTGCGLGIISRDFTFTTYPSSVTISMQGSGTHSYNPEFCFVYTDGSFDCVGVYSGCTADPYYYTTWNVTNTCTLALPQCTQ